MRLIIRVRLIAILEIMKNLKIETAKNRKVERIRSGKFVKNYQLLKNWKMVKMSIVRQKGIVGMVSNLQVLIILYCRVQVKISKISFAIVFKI